MKNRTEKRVRRRWRKEPHCPLRQNNHSTFKQLVHLSISSIICSKKLILCIFFSEKITVLFLPRPLLNYHHLAIKIKAEHQFAKHFEISMRNIVHGLGTRNNKRKHENEQGKIWWWPFYNKTIHTECLLYMVSVSDRHNSISVVSCYQAPSK